LSLIERRDRNRLFWAKNQIKYAQVGHADENGDLACPELSFASHTKMKIPSLVRCSGHAQETHRGPTGGASELGENWARPTARSNQMSV
jgi:hypothetical protein